MPRRTGEFPTRYPSTHSRFEDLSDIADEIERQKQRAAKYSGVILGFQEPTQEIEAPAWRLPNISRKRKFTTQENSVPLDKTSSSWLEKYPNSLGLTEAMNALSQALSRFVHSGFPYAADPIFSAFFESFFQGVSPAKILDLRKDASTQTVENAFYKLLIAEVTKSERLVLSLFFQILFLKKNKRLKTLIPYKADNGEARVYSLLRFIDELTQIMILIQNHPGEIPSRLPAALQGTQIVEEVNAQERRHLQSQLKKKLHNTSSSPKTRNDTEISIQHSKKDILFQLPYLFSYVAHISEFNLGETQTIKLFVEILHDPAINWLISIDNSLKSGKLLRAKIFLQLFSNYIFEKKHTPHLTFEQFLNKRNIPFSATMFDE